MPLLKKSVGANNDTVRVPKPDEPKSADGFELQESIAEGIDLLFVLGETMVAGVIDEFGEFGELVRMNSGRLGEEAFRRAIRSMR